MTAAIAIFVKTPGFSPIKTRLAHAIGREAAETFHTLAAEAVCAVACAVADDLQVCWAVAEPAALDDPRWHRLPRIAQGGGGLGAQQYRVASALLGRYDKVLLTGADIPQMTPAALCEALAVLHDPCTPLVLGEADDGGYWLFGGRIPLPAALWRSVQYSRPDTAQQLRRALQAHGAVGTAQRLFDVDTVVDLARLADALETLPATLPAQRRLLFWLRDTGLAVVQGSASLEDASPSRKCGQAARR